MYFYGFRKKYVVTLVTELFEVCVLSCFFCVCVCISLSSFLVYGSVTVMEPRCKPYEYQWTLVELSLTMS